jgi:hypothetical protein
MPHRVGRTRRHSIISNWAGCRWACLDVDLHRTFASLAMHSGRQFARRVSLHDCAAVTDSALEPLAQHCPRLGTVAPLACGAARANMSYNKSLHSTEVLDVSGCRQITAAACWVCRGGVYMHALSRCQHFRPCIITLVTATNGLSVRQVIARSCPVLRELSLADCRISNIGLGEIGRGCPALSALDISNCTLITGVRMDGDGHRPPVSTPTLSTNQATTCLQRRRQLHANAKIPAPPDYGIQLLARDMHNLTRLRILGCSRVTSRSMSMHGLPCTQSSR